MRLELSDMLTQDTGYRRDFVVTGERPDLEDLALDGGLDGHLSVIRSDAGLIVSGEASAPLLLECHRCLRGFTRPTHITFQGEFVDRPDPQAGDEQGPINNGTIDVTPIIRQELIVNLPIKLLCEPDCPGLCSQCGQRNTPDHAHQPRPVTKEKGK